MRGAGLETNRGWRLRKDTARAPVKARLCHTEAPPAPLTQEGVVLEAGTGWKLIRVLGQMQRLQDDR